MVYNIEVQDNTVKFEKDILKENPPKFSYLIKLFRYVFSSARLMCGVYLGCAIILSVIQPVTAFIWGKYIDSADSFMESAESKIAQLISLIGLTFLYWFIKFLCDILNRYLYGGEDIERLSKVQDHRLQEKFQVKLFKKISKLYPDYMEVPRINDIIERSFNSMGGEWSSLQRGVIIEGYVIMAKVISVIMIAISLYIFNPLLCLVVLVAPIPTLYTTYIGNKLSFKFVRDNEEVLREAGYYQNILLGNSAKEVRVFNLFDFFFVKWKVLADDYIIREKKNQFNIFILGTISGFISNIASVSASVMAIVLMTQGKLSVGALGAVLTLIGTLIDSTSQLFESIANYISKKNEAAQFFEMIDLEEQVTKVLDKAKPMQKIDCLQTKNLSYRYPLTDQYRIKNIDFTIRQGEKIAFVGENGAGKTTFVKLLTGMLEPSKGEIFLNGVNIKEIDFSSRYDSISNVFQEPAQFNTFTISDNIFLGDVCKERNEEQINDALKFSGFEGVDKDTLLGKDVGGTDISGGQWQKLAIARAYYRHRDFMVLDEPTSNLDPISETNIFEKYLAMMKDKTVIIVTHRISMASLADRIVVFKDGRIVEDGSHKTLLLKDGVYARLYSIQAKWYDR